MPNFRCWCSLQNFRRCKHRTRSGGGLRKCSVLEGLEVLPAKLFDTFISDLDALLWTHVAGFIPFVFLVDFCFYLFWKKPAELLTAPMTMLHTFDNICRHLFLFVPTTLGSPEDCRGKASLSSNRHLFMPPKILSAPKSNPGVGNDHCA